MGRGSCTMLTPLTAISTCFAVLAKFALRLDEFENNRNREVCCGQNHLDALHGFTIRLQPISNLECVVPGGMIRDCIKKALRSARVYLILRPAMRIKAGPIPRFRQAANVRTLQERMRDACNCVRRCGVSSLGIALPHLASNYRRLLVNTSDLER